MKTFQSDFADIRVYKPEELPDPALAAGFDESRDESLLPSKKNQVAAKQLKLVLPSHVGGKVQGNWEAAIWEGAAARRFGQSHQSFKGGEESG